jgi:hypothetical protein
MYLVPDLQLIAQKRNMGCWYASAQMIINWKRTRAQATLVDHPDPSEVPTTVVWEVANRGIVNPQVIELATRLGLRAVPPMTPSLQYLGQLLRSYGPLWTNGKNHIVVLGGIDEAGGRLRVFDPWPPGAGQVDWRPFSSYLGGPNAWSRDTSSSVQAVFLYHP